MPIHWAILAATLLLTGSAAAQSQPRPFRHAPHRALSCRECHTFGEGHRLGRTWTPADCAACHHDPARGLACERCHPASALPAAGRVPVALALSVGEGVKVRELPFEHAVHAAKPCQECHGASPGAAPITECAACHTDHHRPAADCTLCHPPPQPGAHGLPAHVTCGGSGCHTRSGETPAGRGEAFRPALTRSLCLVCHIEQKDHEPGGTCHVCHRVPETRW